MQNKLIFIEGISGVGKTTTASLLKNKLRDAGDEFICHLEGDCGNPLDPFGGKYPPEMPLAMFTETYADCWRRFMENQFRRETRFILDGTLLHHQINDLMRDYHASGDMILSHLNILLQIVQPLHPIVFYLTSGDVAKRLLNARESRGQSIPSNEQIAFWENRKRMDLFVLERFSAKSYVLNVDDGWDVALEKMLASITV